MIFILSSFTVMFCVLMLILKFLPRMMINNSPPQLNFYTRIDDVNEYAEDVV